MHVAKFTSFFNKILEHYASIFRAVSVNRFVNNPAAYTYFKHGVIN